MVYQSCHVLGPRNCNRNPGFVSALRCRWQERHGNAAVRHWRPPWHQRTLAVKSRFGPIWRGIRNPQQYSFIIANMWFQHDPHACPALDFLNPWLFNAPVMSAPCTTILVGQALTGSMTVYTWLISFSRIHSIYHLDPIFGKIGWQPSSDQMTTAHDGHLRPLLMVALGLLCSTSETERLGDSTGMDQFILGCQWYI